MTSGLCFSCRPFEFESVVVQAIHCHGSNDTKPLMGVLGGFRCSCSCNGPIPSRFVAPQELEAK